MKVGLFSLCDYAVNNGGKLTIVGSFDSLAAPKFPWRAYFGVAVKMDIAGEHLAGRNFNMYIYPEGAASNRIFSVKTPLGSNVADKLVLAGNIKGLIFEKPGMYHYVLAVDDEVVMDYGFSVEKEHGKE